MTTFPKFLDHTMINLKVLKVLFFHSLSVWNTVKFGIPCFRLRGKSMQMPSFQLPFGGCHEEGMVKNCTGPLFLGNPQDNAKIQENQDKQSNQTARKNEIKISRKGKYMLIIIIIINTLDMTMSQCWEGRQGSKVWEKTTQEMRAEGQAPQLYLISSVTKW